MRSLPAILCLMLLCSLLPSRPASAEAYQVGFRTLGSWSAESGLRVDVNVWYPSVRPPRDLNYAPWEISAARGGKAVEGRFPLLLLSHDTAGTRFSYHTTAALLAASGFVVATPTHSGDNMNNMEQLLTWKQLENRVRELAGTIDMVLADPETEPSIDQRRIGLVGFGAGGTAALLMGGALPDCTGWADYCSRADQRDMYCNPWARDRLNTLCRQLPLTKSLADPRVRAVAAIAPGFGMLFNRASFRHFYPPLLLVAATADNLNKTDLHARRIYELMNRKARWLALEGADVGALMAPCPQSLAAELPELCRSVSPEERASIQQAMHASLGDFFLHYLGDSQNLPPIAEPPDLTPPPPPQPDPPQPPAPQQKRRRAG